MFVPILHAVTSHKDVITKKVFIEGVLSELEDQIKNKETEKGGHLSGVDGAVDQGQVDAVQVEIDELNEKKASKVSTLMKQTTSSGVFWFTQRQATLLVRTQM